jgi:hypothetical protein
MPLPSSTADAQGPSWCEPIMTVSSSAPSSSPTTLCDSTSTRVDSTVSRTRTGPRASCSRSQAPSEPFTHTPGIGRAIAS